MGIATFDKKGNLASMTIKKNHGSFRSNTNRNYPDLATKQTLSGNIFAPVELTTLLGVP